MARSSGGGSRSGGSHSSSSRSSSSRSSSGRSGSYRSSSYSRSSYNSSYGNGYYRSGYGRKTRFIPIPITSYKQRKDATRYSYYNKHNEKKYIWCSYNPAERDKTGWARYFLLIVYLPFVLVVFAMLKDSFNIPHRLINTESRFVIEDNIGAVSDKDGLYAAMTEFYNVTGVTPAFLTVYDGEWESNYDSLSNFGIDNYYDLFEDENHWLIVYSRPKKSKSDGFVNWKWEGIAGDNITGAVFDNVIDAFNTEMQNSLYAEKSPDEAMSKSLRKSLGEWKSYIDFSMLIPAIIIGLFIIFHAYFMVFRGKRKYIPNAVPDPEVLPTPAPAPTPTPAPVEPEIVCEYCGTRFTYDVLEKGNCPSCGAPFTK